MPRLPKSRWLRVILARIQRSPNYQNGAFRNLDDTFLGTEGSTGRMLRQWMFGREQRKPSATIPIV